MSPRYIPPRWQALFDERQKQHILFCAGYARNFAHGAPGHLDMIVIALLLDCLVAAEQESAALQAQVETLLHEHPAPTGEAAP